MMVHSLFQFFLWAGSEWVLWMLFATSVAAMAVMIDRWRQLRGTERVGAAFWREHGGSWLDSGLPASWKVDSESLARRYPCSELRALVLLVRSAEKSAEDRERLLAGFISAERIRLERNLAVLGTLGNSAPFIGLLGTVLGIVRAFYDLGQATDGGGGLATISGGLAEALVTTAMGLLVALPSAMAYNFFQRKIKGVMGRIHSLGGLVIGSSN